MARLALSDWIIQYDPHGMPAVLTGRVHKTVEPFNRGDTIVLENIFQLDLNSNVVVDRGGVKWSLEGEGRQSVIVDYTEPFRFIQVHDVEEYGYDDDPEFD